VTDLSAPVIVGVAQVTNRPAGPTTCVEPLTLLVDAAAMALDDVNASMPVATLVATAGIAPGPRSS